jgi:hypothetical protein
MQSATRSLAYSAGPHFVSIGSFTLFGYSLCPFVSPRKLRCIADAYASMNRSTLPISFEETEITLKHLLAIFTPPSSMRGGGKILNSVEYIVSQLGEPFDLQRTNP